MNQKSQSRTGGYTDFTSKMIYFGTDQYRCTISSLPFFFNIYKYICVCVCVCVGGWVCMYIYIYIIIKVYHKTFPQFKTNYSWF